MQELYRVLKADGKAFLQVPYSIGNKTIEEKEPLPPKERLRRFGQKDHVRLYGYQSFMERLNKAGFYVDPIKLAKDHPQQKFHGLQENDTIFVCYKSRQ